MMVHGRIMLDLHGPATATFTSESTLQRFEEVRHHDRLVNATVEQRRRAYFYI